MLSDDTIKRALAFGIENENTRSNYLARLSKLSEHLGAPLYEILKAPSTHYARIEETYDCDSTRKNAVIAILAAFKHIEALREKKRDAHDRWRKIHENLQEREEARYKKNKPSEAQMSNYVSFEDLRQKYEALRARKDAHAKKRDSFDLVLVSVALHLRPKRADLGNVAILSRGEKKSPSRNYLYLSSPRDSHIVIKEFKTAKTYEKIVEKLPEALYEDIAASLERHPRRWLFCDRAGSAYSKSGYTQFVIRTFERLFGKRLGVTMLRHIYVSERLDFNKMTQEELDREARLMGQSADLQRKYRWVI